MEGERLEAAAHRGVRHVREGLPRRQVAEGPRIVPGYGVGGGGVMVVVGGCCSLPTPFHVRVGVCVWWWGVCVLVVVVVAVSLNQLL